MQASNEIEFIDGTAVQRITPLDAVAPFLMTIVSNADLWMFVSSTGGLTAGRVRPADCVFPYETDDRLHRTGIGAGGRTGPATVLRIVRDGEAVVWRPFSGDAGPRRRSVAKSLLGHAVFFEEHDPDLGFTFRYRWAPSDRYGWVRTATLVHDGGVGVAEVEVVDGLVGVMPWGVDVGVQQSMSNLANAYRRSQIVGDGLGIYSLEALIVDRPEPAEALRATTVWSTGLAEPRYSVDDRPADAAADGSIFEPTALLTGRPGSYLVATTIVSAPGSSHRWHIVADVAQSHSSIARLRQDLRICDDLAKAVDADIDRCSIGLVDLVAGADGIQSTASPTVDAHHVANTLFNVMRGGTFPHGNRIDGSAFRAFVADRNAGVAARHRSWLDELPEQIDVGDLRARAGRPGDPDLGRLAHEYLPLAFSRRHGDPSRPWNHFEIRVRDDDGEPVLTHQGNWRDIFQNWEALCRSYPEFLPSIIAKFVNASTGDGHNPYRITSDGIDWEIPEPDKPWSGIGYWGDHQIVYLYRLLLAQQQHDPSWLRAELGRRVHSFADVPYRIVPFEQLVTDPKRTVEFDADLHVEIERRVERLGADGRLVLDENGRVVHVSLLEKLLVPALAKLSNFVPGGGIWMNTQRPEWNDANNALVGFGTSMVTLAHLRRYLRLLDDVTADLSDSILVSADVIEWAGRVTEILEQHDPAAVGSVVDDDVRGRIVRALGEAFSDHRARFYASGPAAPQPMPPALLRRLVRTSLRHLDATLRAARRPDGLFDAYCLLEFDQDGRALRIDRLPAMLEGQVAAIGSGLLDVADVCELVDAMYRSELHRPDLDTFLLYPATPRPGFLDRNRIPDAEVSANPLLRYLVEVGDRSVVECDVDGGHHFAPHLRNAGDLAGALDLLAADARFAELVAGHRSEVCDLFEQVFDHHRFTGRSATMYAYEGIGSVYWHMVAKLLLAVQEVILDADAMGPHAGSDREPVDRLIAWYVRIRSGLGFNKTAVEYGAFPTDPYSHTPAGAGAQQPGMTGQVKEELLTRRAELGLVVVDGRIRVVPTLLSPTELRTEPGALEYVDVDGRRCRIEVPAGAAACTICRVPVIVHGTEPGSDRGSESDIQLVATGRSGDRRTMTGQEFDQAISRDVFSYAGEITRLDVVVPLEAMRR